MANIYLWYKALHIISFISWMAGMLYLPRLFVYHSKAQKNSSENETFKIMERKLLRFIMTPAMIATFIFGFLLISTDISYYMKSGWLHFKLLLIFIMAGFHGYFAVTVRKFANNQNNKGEKFYRIINEIPAVIMIIAVFLAVFKPF